MQRAKCRACQKRAVCITDLCGPCYRDLAAWLANRMESQLEDRVAEYVSYLAGDFKVPRPPGRGR